jgi:hypothetical protein
MVSLTNEIAAFKPVCVLKEDGIFAALIVPNSSFKFVGAFFSPHGQEQRKRFNFSW